MPLKKDPATRRAIELELELPGTPEQIWHAMATGAGYAAWFTPARIEEKVGGRIAFEFGPGVESGGVVTIWDPPSRFGYEEIGWSGDAPPLATEILIEAKSGGTCKVRMVHSLFSDRDDWDKEMESFEQGWPGFFEILRFYLKHFAGQPAAPIGATGSVDGSFDAAWTAITRALGLENASVGDRRAAPPGAPALAGILERIDTDSSNPSLMLRLEAPAPGTALIGAYRAGQVSRVACSLFFYGEESAAMAAHEAPVWEQWMKQKFPATEEKAAG